MKEPTPLTAALAGRISRLRAEVFGEGRSGLEAVAAELSLPCRTWANYESGVTMPATVMIHFVVATGANPRWLMTGAGSAYHRRRGTSPVVDRASLPRRGRGTDS